jgi:hypothetical protein
MVADVQVVGNSRIITPTGLGSFNEAVNAVRAYAHMSNIGGETTGWSGVAMFDGWQVVSPTGDTFRFKPFSIGVPMVQRITEGNHTKMSFAVGHRSRRGALRSKLDW